MRRHRESAPVCRVNEVEDEDDLNKKARESVPSRPREESVRVYRIASDRRIRVKGP